MRTNIKIISIFAFGILSSIVFVSKGETQSKRHETAGQKFKNIQVLKDMPADQLGKVMNIMSASLGVNCDFCHAGYEFEKDDKEHKQITREMIKMTFDLNEKYFEGKQEVSCNTCHNGQPHPRAQPDLVYRERAPRMVQPNDKPSAEAVIARYEKAVGAQVKKGVIKANRIEPDGKTIEPMSIAVTGHNVRVDTHYDKYLVSEIFDGKDVVKLGNGSPIELKPDEKEQIKREAQLLNSSLKSIYNKFDLPMLIMIDGRKAYQINATTVDGFADELFFDVVTGLLIRRRSVTKTVLGDFIFQADYFNYKKFCGARIPTKTSYAMPAIYWTRRIIGEVKTRGTIDR